MSNPPPARRSSSLVACLVALCAALPSAAETDFPIALHDPVSGQSIHVRPGNGVLHVVFFGTWCPPCVDELESLAELEARWESRGYRLVIIAVQNRHDVERLSRFVERHGPPGRLLFDSTGAVEKMLRGDRLPTHIVFAADGSELARSSALDAELEQAIEQTLRPRRAGGEPQP